MQFTFYERGRQPYNIYFSIQINSVNFYDTALVARIEIKYIICRQLASKILAAALNIEKSTKGGITE